MSRSIFFCFLLSLERTDISYVVVISARARAVIRVLSVYHSWWRTDRRIKRRRRVCCLRARVYRLKKEKKKKKTSDYRRWKKKQNETNGVFGPFKNLKKKKKTVLLGIHVRIVHYNNNTNNPNRISIDPDYTKKKKK